MTTPSPPSPDRDPTGFIRAAMPFCDTLGVEALEVSGERVVLTLAHDRRWETAGGRLHGGALMTLADAAGAALAHMRLPEGATGTATVASTTEFVGAASRGAITAAAEALHAGRTAVTVRVETRDADGELLAHTTAVQLVLR